MKGQKFIPLLVVAAGLLAYQNSFTVPFIFDDVLSISENPTIHRLWPIWQPLSPPHRGGLTVEGRPLINLSLAINYALGGYNVWGYHALNLTVHILAGLTLLGIVRRTLLQPRLRSRFGAVANEFALATAVIWTVHPLQTEAVTYIVQRAESITGLFYLFTLYCFIRGTGSRQPHVWYRLSVAACALGMASKEVMVSAPLMLLLYDRAFISGSFREAWRRRWPLYLGLAATWILLGYLLIFTGSLNNALTNAKAIGVDRWEYLLTQPGVILYYLRLCVWPSPLCLDYAWGIAKTWMSILPPTVVIVILLGASVWAWKKNPAPLRAGPVWGFVGAWFFLILAPSSSFIPLNSPVYEHRMYLPLAAVAVLGVIAIHALAGRRSVVAVVVLAVGLGFLTWRRNQDYRSAFAIWSDTVTKSPNNSHAQYNLGVVLWEAGNLREAIRHYEQALRIRPDLAEAHSNLGVALAQLGRVPEAIEHCEQALRIKPGLAEAHYDLGVVLEQTGKRQDAIGHWEQAVRLKPDFAEAHYSLGLALQQAGKLPDAIGHYEQALRVKPGYFKAHNALGVALEQIGKLQEAAAQYQRALRLNPDFAEAYVNLGAALVQLGRVPEAVGRFEKALRLQPDSARAHFSLGLALEQTGRLRESMKHYEEALRLKPDSAESANNLAWLLATLPPADGGDPVRAVTLARRACELTGDRLSPYLDTLAAAYAAAGRFDEAIAAAQKAIELASAAGQPQVAKEIEGHRQLYRSGQAYRR